MVHLTTGSFDDGERFVEGDKGGSPGRSRSTCRAMIYLDYNATTPLAPEAMEAMLPFLERDFGNPSSIHRAGRTARAAFDPRSARER